MIYTLIAFGTNSIEIPCMIFENKEQALEECIKIFEKECDLKNEEGYVWYTSDLKLKDDDINGLLPRYIANKIFTSYYFGCGSPWRFVLKPVPFNTKFVCFDLD